MFTAIAAVTGAVVGAGLGYMNSQSQARIRRNALKKAEQAELLDLATNYGPAKTEAMLGAGEKMRREQNAMLARDTTGQQNLDSGTAFSNINNTAPNTTDGTAAENRERLNKETVSKLIQNESGRQQKQAGIDAKAQNAKLQEGMNTAKDLINLGNQAGVGSMVGSGLNSLTGYTPEMGGYKQYFKDAFKGNVQKTPASDENLKQYNDNDKLPPSTEDDALKQIDNVEYQYKDPSIPGCDSDEHVGVTAQTLLKSDYFRDCVVQGEDGYLRVNKDLLLNKIIPILEQKAEQAGIKTEDLDIDNIDFNEGDEWKMIESILSGLSADVKTNNGEEVQEN